MSWFWVLFILDWLPTVIAALRSSPNAIAIFALNLLLGWTVLGWIVAFIWSLAAIHAPAAVSVHIANHSVAERGPVLLGDTPVQQLRDKT